MTRQQIKTEILIRARICDLRHLAERTATAFREEQLLAKAREARPSRRRRRLAARASPLADDVVRSFAAAAAQGRVANSCGHVLASLRFQFVALSPPFAFATTLGCARREFTICL
jgi:hypothetical protein